MQNFKPLLSGKVNDTSKLPFPMLASPKLDGIRAVNLGTGLYSRNLKAIPNKHVQDLFGGPDYMHLDGELICGSPTDKDCYRNTNSAVMSQDGTPDVKLYIFDSFRMPGDPFTDRYALAEGHAKNLENVVMVPQVLVRNEQELLAFEEQCLDAGYEGVMVRDPKATYKFGRSTDKEGTLLKLKRFIDGEAKIIGFEQLMSNQNEATKDALGHTERSTNRDGLVPMNTMGALIVKDIVTGVEFNIGTGFTEDDRRYFWAHQDSLFGRIVKYKSFAIGVKDKPRFPVYLGMRSEEDL